MSGARPRIDPIERFDLGRGRLMVYSERWPIKYLLSQHGLCLGIDTKRRSFLFLICREGIVVRRRPVGDTIVEDLHYHIPGIVRALKGPLETAAR